MEHIEKLCQKVIEDNPDRVIAFIKGERGVIGCLISKVVLLDAEVDPVVIKGAIERILTSRREDVPGIGGTSFTLLLNTN